jgi:AcrR family transcriptional regulator
MLARTHEGKPGLPRGRSHLPPPAVSASQRERLLRSVIAAVSEHGYQAVTVADIVRGARVSKNAFYAHFANKEECFLAATGEGRELMIARVTSASRALPAEADDEDLLRAACRGFLEFLLADEPAFARVFYIHMPAAGPQAVGRLDAAPRIFAQMNRRWHERARERHPDWPAVPPEAYLALAGATAELARSMVYAGRTDALPDLEDTLVALHLAVMAGRPWPA